jgi:hypothetical protein
MTIPFGPISHLSTKIINEKEKQVNPKHILYLIKVIAKILRLKRFRPKWRFIPFKVKKGNKNVSTLVPSNGGFKFFNEKMFFLFQLLCFVREQGCSKGFQVKSVF